MKQKRQIGLELNKIINGDCLEVLKTFPNNCIDLIVTSPPYADSRKSDYGGIRPNQYVEWMHPRVEEFYRVLKPRGTLILNIKEKVVDSERHTYAIELILEMRGMGWLWTEEFIWHKRNSYPGKWPNRFRDAWERCLQFNKNKNFKMYQDTVKVPIGDWAVNRLKNLTKNDKKRTESNSKSKFGRKVANWKGKKKVYPTNVLHIATECANRNHSAVFPQRLPKWFIRLFTKKGDIVLDPFVGSGTTPMVCMQLGRKYIGVDINENICKVAVDNIAATCK